MHLLEYLDRHLSPGSGVAVCVSSLCALCTCRQGLAGDPSASQRASAYAVSHPRADARAPAHGWLRLTAGNKEDSVIFNHVVSVVPPDYAGFTSFKVQRPTM